VHWWIPDLPLWEKITRPIVVYLFILIMFRLLGKRQVAQMTPFDLVVLLMLSNVMQNAMIGNDNSLAGGLIGGGSLLLFNWLVTRAAYRNRFLQRKIEGDPALLIHHGRVLEGALRREGLSREDLLANLRTQGVFNIEDVRAAVLENSGRLSVLKAEKQPDSGA
jgi:uncharacterized membrane protein YcaP (DUF421 family)